MNAPFFEITVRFRSGDEACPPGSRTRARNRRGGQCFFYSDKSTTRVELLAQKLSRLTQQRQVPAGQELLATEVHRLSFDHREPDTRL